MTAEQETPARKTWRERQIDAAVEFTREHNELRDRVSKIVLDDREHGRHIGELIQIAENDFVVEVVKYDRGNQESQWTTVVDGKGHHEYFDIVDMALLHIVVRRNDPEPHSSQAHWYAARVARVN